MKQPVKTSVAGKLKDKIALVTGAGGDIGCAISLQFAAEGAAVVCADVDIKTARQTSEQIEIQGGKASHIECDVTDSNSAKASVSEAVRRFGALHILVNNAAHFLRDATLPELDEVGVQPSFCCQRNWRISDEPVDYPSYDPSRGRKHHPYCLPDGPCSAGEASDLLRYQGGALATGQRNGVGPCRQWHTGQQPIARRNRNARHGHPMGRHGAGGT